MLLVSLLLGHVLQITPQCSAHRVILTQDAFRPANGVLKHFDSLAHFFGRSLLIFHQCHCQKSVRPHRGGNDLGLTITIDPSAARDLLAQERLCLRIMSKPEQRRRQVCYRAICLVGVSSAFFQMEGVYFTCGTLRPRPRPPPCIFCRRYIARRRRGGIFSCRSACGRGASGHVGKSNCNSGSNI